MYRRIAVLRRSIRPRPKTDKELTRTVSSCTGDSRRASLSGLRKILPDECYVDDPVEREKYGHDWLGLYSSPNIEGITPQFVIRPGATEEVSEILKYCNSEKIAVVPQGGNTGLVGGGIPHRGDEVILSTERMSRIISFDSAPGILTCESGCILSNLEDHVSGFGYTMPLDLGSAGSCLIGGNIATNAGGIRLLRYGSLRENVLGLKVVLSDGQILDLNCSSPMRKDNTGYSLKQLFIGSEGTLGVITEASLLTYPAPQAVHLAVIGLKDFQQVVKTLQSAKNELGEILSAFEYWDARCMKSVLQWKPDLFPANPLGEEGNQCPFFVLIETRGSDAEHDGEKFFQFLENFEIGTLVADRTKVQHLWSLRELIPSSLRFNGGRLYKYDISLPVHEFSSFTQFVENSLLDQGFVDFRAFQFGHIGDGNLHFNAVSKSADPHLKIALESVLYNKLQECGGSISAEHGIGIQKSQALLRAKTKLELDLMLSIKATFDPQNLMNPGKLFSNK